MVRKIRLSHSKLDGRCQSRKISNGIFFFSSDTTDFSIPRSKKRDEKNYTFIIVLETRCDQSGKMEYFLFLRIQPIFDHVNKN